MKFHFFAQGDSIADAMILELAIRTLWQCFTQYIDDSSLECPLQLVEVDRGVYCIELTDALLAQDFQDYLDEHPEYDHWTEFPFSECDNEPALVEIPCECV